MSLSGSEEFEDDEISIAAHPYRLLHPFTNTGSGFRYTSSGDSIGIDQPRTLVELRMCALSAAIREKLDWHVKFRDESIRAKWIEEIRQQQQDMHESLRLTDNMASSP